MDSFQDSDNYSWFLIFHHNVKNGDLFKDENEALYCRSDNKFSLLSKINDKFKINDEYFEFMITYPEYDDYIHFTQTKNPITINKTEEGTVVVKRQSALPDRKSFKGLALGGHILALLDSNGKDPGWYYAIGQMMFVPDYNNSIPGPNWYYNNSTNLFSEVNLYIKIIDLSLLPYLYSSQTGNTQNYIQFHHILPYIAIIIK